MISLAIQLAASLVAVLLLALICWKLGLGGDVRLRGEAQARAMASEALFGFEADDVALDRAGIGALLRDKAGRVMLLRRHGVHFVARLLESHEGLRLDHNFLTLAISERQFGTITLDLGAKAQSWAGNLRRLGT